jgi:hypothetical protein
MRPDQALEAVKRVIDQSNVSVGDVITHEPNYAREDNRLESPWVSIQPITIPRSDPHDTDRVGYETNASGARIGKVYQTTWVVDMQLDVYVPESGPGDASILGHAVQDALFPHDSKRDEQPFPDGGGGTLADVERFRVGDAERRDDLTASRSLRRWYQELSMRVSDRASTTEDPITAVETPSDGQAAGQSDGSIVLQYQN